MQRLLIFYVQHTKEAIVLFGINDTTCHWVVKWCLQFYHLLGAWHEHFGIHAAKISDMICSYAI